MKRLIPALLLILGVVFLPSCEAARPYLLSPGMSVVDDCQLGNPVSHCGENYSVPAHCIDGRGPGEFTYDGTTLTCSHTPLLRWAPPVLDDPITLVNPGSEDLDPAQDYILEYTTTVTNNLTITGGNDVVIVGLHVNRSALGKGLVVRDQTGTMHIEGAHIEGNLNEGIQMEQSEGGSVQIQNTLIEQVTGSQAGDHADVIQTYGGPVRLLIDRVVGTTTYQGLFMRPNDDGSSPPVTEATKQVAVSNMHVEGLADSHYLYWYGVDNGIQYPVEVDNVSYSLIGRSNDPSLILWPVNNNPWFGVTFEPSIPTDILSATPGSSYVTPGYQIHYG